MTYLNIDQPTFFSSHPRTSFALEAREEDNQVQAAVRPRRAWITYG